ncbi:aldo keto reductase [Coniophora puteana RWD-64-598 SS2]|uniref:Aldo keto reductase n=1 Tax=Coniophora puteana (strain RWD-64-598) TaxID=741705 RepID=R7SDG2_CONPW|nr:aldo keto reductase [Coniophora puteana RWD-64-598 SS2]EIW74186.1 aldo keto reductase [Coniophora puteana RWD-64-598 SS2]
MSTTTFFTPTGEVVVNKIGHGLMSMTATATITPDKQCFEAIKAGVDSLPPGVKMFLNAGEFYGPNASPVNLEMLSRFFEKYPDYAEKTFLSVKGGMQAGSLVADGSDENLARSVNTIVEKLRGFKKVDLFQCARVDKKVPVEQSIATLARFVKEGKIGSIGMSEVRAETLLRGHKVHPITTVEIEVSPWEYSQEVRDVINAAKENNIVVVAYSPIGHGFLSGEIRKLEDFAADDRRRMHPRFQPGNLEKNLVIVDQLTAIATAKGITPAQLSIAWVSSLGPHVLPLPGSARTARQLENLAANSVTFTPEELDKVNEVVRNAEPAGTRYPEFLLKDLWA